MRNIFYLLAILLVFTACGDNQPEEIKWKSIDHDDFKIGLPEFMDEMQGLNEYAVMEYGNRDENLYLIILRDKKEVFLDLLSLEDSLISQTDVHDYTGKIAEMMKENSGISDFSVLDTKTKNDWSTVFAAFSDRVDGKDYYYHLGITESADYFYQLMFFTPVTKKKEFIPVMDSSILSFQPHSRLE